MKLEETLKRFPSGLKVYVLERLPEAAFDEFWDHLVHDHLGRIFEVREVCKSDFFRLDSKLPYINESIIWIKNDALQTTFWVFPEWLSGGLDLESEKCICSIDKLMFLGCSCGQMKREREENYKPNNSHHYF